MGSTLSSNKHFIAEAVQELGLKKSDLREIPPGLASHTLKEIQDHFCTRQGARWWWECFRQNLPTYSIQLETTYDLLDQIVPVKNKNKDKIWFVVEEDTPDIFRLYIGTISVIQKIIKECPFFEYYLVSFDYDWLICENHHNNLIAVGDKAVETFRANANGAEISSQGRNDKF